MEKEESNRKLRDIYLRTTDARSTSANHELTTNYRNEMNKLGFQARDLAIKPHRGLPNVMDHEHQWLIAKGFLPRFPRNAVGVPMMPVRVPLSPEEEAERKELQKVMFTCVKGDNVKEKMGDVAYDRLIELNNKKTRFESQQERNAELDQIKESLQGL